MSNQILIDLDKEGKILSVSESVQRVLDYSPQSLVGRSIYGTILPHVNNAATRLARAADLGSSIVELRNKDGGRLWVKFKVDRRGDRYNCTGIPLGSNRGDETDELLIMFEVMREKIGLMVKAIAIAAQEVSEYADTISSSSQELSSSSNQVSQSVQQISTSVQTQAKSLSEIATLAKESREANEILLRDGEEMAQKARRVDDEASAAREDGNYASEKLTQIRAAMSKAMSATNEMVSSASQISGVTITIKEIADQVSLLALNASIEPARAGDAGKGFAVVAEEIRKLAGDVRESVDKVGSLMRTVEDKTNGAVLAIKDAVENVDKGVTTINNALERLKRISTAAEEMIAAVSRVRVKISENSDAVKKVEENVNSLAAVSEESAASVEEITSAIEEQHSAVEQLSNIAQELSKVVRGLREEVEKFKTN